MDDIGIFVSIYGILVIVFVGTVMSIMFESKPNLPSFKVDNETFKFILVCIIMLVFSAFCYYND